MQDYVRSYLGEGKEAKEFAKQFLEQRSKWRQSQRNVQQYEEDNMCIPAKAVNPGQVSDFHEVKVHHRYLFSHLIQLLTVNLFFDPSQKLKSRKRRCKKLTPVYWGLVSLPRQIELMSENETSSTECKVARIARQDLLKIFRIEFKEVWRQ